MVRAYSVVGPHNEGRQRYARTIPARERHTWSGQSILIRYTVIEYRAKKNMLWIFWEFWNFWFKEYIYGFWKLLNFSQMTSGIPTETIVKFLWFRGIFDFLYFYTTLWSYRTGDPAKQHEQKKKLLSKCHQKWKIDARCPQDFVWCESTWYVPSSKYPGRW